MFEPRELTEHEKNQHQTLVQQATLIILNQQQVESRIGELQQQLRQLFADDPDALKAVDRVATKGEQDAAALRIDISNIALAKVFAVGETLQELKEQHDLLQSIRAIRRSLSTSDTSPLQEAAQVSRTPGRGRGHHVVAQRITIGMCMTLGTILLAALPIGGGENGIEIAAVAAASVPTVGAAMSMVSRSELVEIANSNLRRTL
ncbi:hypothetical protein [Nocardia asiatica]|uniref:hypothetical protein n=1 Tax=Nocardia asiatica TaxID=209252 RepID=UPI002458E14D|nr:hypothetical protein [Nocardia asiatica]